MKKGLWPGFLKAVGVEFMVASIEELADIRSRIFAAYIRSCDDGDYDRQRRLKIMCDLVDEEIERVRVRKNFKQLVNMPLPTE